MDVLARLNVRCVVLANEHRRAWKESLSRLTPTHQARSKFRGLVVIKEERLHVRGRVVGVEAVGEPSLFLLQHVFMLSSCHHRTRVNLDLPRLVNMGQIVLRFVAILLNEESVRHRQHLWLWIAHTQLYDLICILEDGL